MTISNLLIPNISNVSSFHQLTIFICHLFIDGHFRTAHILYDPNAFDGQLINDIYSNCPASIPWLITDVTKPFSTSWQPNENTDHILQLIFIDPNYLPEDIDSLREIFTYYQIIIVSSAVGSNMMDQAAVSNQFKTNRTNVPLILIQNPVNDLMLIQRSSTSNETAEVCSNVNAMLSYGRIEANHRMCDNKRKNMFDLTFGANEKMWFLTVSYPVAYSPNQNIIRIDEVWQGMPFVANLYVSILNASYINRTSIKYGGIGHDSHDFQIFYQKKSRFYGELTTNVHLLDNKSL